MEYLHWQIHLNAGALVRVDLECAANVNLMDDINYAAFNRGDSYNYYGGYRDRTPAWLQAPHPGHWHVVVHLGGYAGRIAASVAVA